MATSRSRTTPLASVRFARFAQAINNTIPTAAMSTKSDLPNSSDTVVTANGIVFTPHPLLDEG
jgi:hypothetical protein